MIGNGSVLGRPMASSPLLTPLSRRRACSPSIESLRVASSRPCYDPATSPSIDLAPTVHRPCIQAVARPLVATGCLPDAAPTAIRSCPEQDKVNWWISATIEHLEGLCRWMRWRFAVAKEMELSLATAFGSERGDDYGSDCTGADAPYHALQEMRTYLLRHRKIYYTLRRRFGSEDPGKKGDAPRNFAALNSPPDVMFADMTQRRANGGENIYTGSFADTPSGLQWYTCGFVCWDNSSENRCHRRAVETKVTRRSGRTTTTLVACVEYIKEHRPDRFVLENTYSKSMWRALCTLLSSVTDYVWMGFVVNSRISGLPQNRDRLYVVGVVAF